MESLKNAIYLHAFIESKLKKQLNTHCYVKKQD